MNLEIFYAIVALVFTVCVIKMIFLAKTKRKKPSSTLLKLVSTITMTGGKTFKVYKFIADATFKQIFESLSASESLDGLCLTGEQRETFCSEHTDQLSSNGFNFFLMKKGDYFFVAGVRIDFGGLRVRVYRLELGYVWLGDNRNRLVVPQL